LRIFDVHYNDADKAQRVHQLSLIVEYINSYTKNDEHGEPPDNDTLLEALQLPDNYDSIIDKAYELYYSRRKTNK